MSNSNETYLVITPFFPSNQSFVGSYIYDQVVEINKQTDYNIKIVKISSIFSNEQDYHYQGFDVFIFKLIDFPFFIFPGIFDSMNRIRFRNFLRRKGINNIKFAHGHVTYPASYLLSIFRCNTIIQHHGLDVLQLMNGRSTIIRKLQRNYLIRRSIKRLNIIDLNVGVSNKVINNLLSFQKDYCFNHVVLYNGVDLDKFKYKKQSDNNIFTIGCIGNFWEIKDQITLIKSIKLLKDQGVEVLGRFIGSGDKLKNCKNFVEENNLRKNISFEDEMDHKYLNNFYNSIDLFVLPSYFEALGCVYLESWATHTPFIAVKGQGIEELIPDCLKGSMLVSKSDPNELSRKILDIYNNPMSLKFNDNYGIKHTIREFLSHDIFK